MSDQNDLTGKIGLDTTDFKTAIASINRELRVVESGFRASAASLGDWSKSADGLESRIKALNSQIELQQKKAEALNSEYERVAKEKGANSKAAQELQIKLNKENETLGKMQSELRLTQTSLDSMGKEEKTTADKSEQLDKAEDKAAQGTNRLGTALRSLPGHLKSVAAGIGDVIKKAAELAAGLAIGLMAGVTAVATGIGALVVKSGEWADQFATLSGQTGISTTRLQELDYIGKKLDVDLGTMTGSMSKMIRSLNSAKDGTGPAADAFKALGVSIKDTDGNFRDAQDIWADAIAALGNVQNETERDALAMSIFGKSAMELNPLITAGSDELARLAAEANKVGAVMSEQDVQALDQFKDSTDALGNTFKGIIGTIAAKLAPAFTTIIGKVNEFLASAAGKKIVEDLGNAFGILGNAITIIVNSLGSADPLTSIGSQLENLGKGNKLGILERIGSALMGFSDTFNKLQSAFKNGGISGLLEAIIPKGGAGGLIAQFSTQIGTMLSSLLLGFAKQPAQLLQVGLNIIQGLATGLTTAIPALLPVFLQLIQSFVSFITTTLPILVQTGLTIVLQLGMALVLAIPQLLPVVIQLLTSFIQFIVSNLPMIITAAVQLLVTLANGIAQALPTLIPTVLSIIPTIILTLLQNLPLLITAAIQLILALVQGIVNALPMLIQSMPVIVQTIVDVIIQNFPLIISAAIQLIQTIVTALVENLPLIGQAAIDIINSLLQGFVEMLPDIITAAGDIIQTIVDAIADLGPTILSVGTDIVSGIWQGIQNAWQGLLNDMAGIIAGLPDWVKKLLGIASPSRVFAEIGQNMAAGLGVGFQDSYRSIRDQIGRAIEGLSAQASLTVSGGPGIGGLQFAPARAPIQIILQGTPERELDMRRMARYVAEEIQRRNL